MLFSVIMVILFCLQGSYNGNNTIDEILFGIELGVVIAFFSHYFIRPLMDKHLSKLMDGMFVNRHRHVVLGSTVGIITLFLIVTIAYMASVGSFKPAQ